MKAVNPENLNFITKEAENREPQLQNKRGTKKKKQNEGDNKKWQRMKT